MDRTINELLTRYYAGETTLAEERQLRDYFRDIPNVPESLQAHAPLFQYVTNSQAERLPIGFIDRIDQHVSPGTSGSIHQFTTWTLRLAAGISLLLIGFAGGYLYTRSKATAATEMAINNQPEAVLMKKTLTFDATNQTSASDRIQAVNQSYDLDQADHEITQLLINTLNFDANVNVRLAACQALLHFKQEEGVREALIQSLRIQKDPNVQLTLIDALVAIKEKRATTDMQWLARNQQVLEVVRLKAEEGIGALQSPS